MNVVLIGLRGSGKSTVGTILASRLKWAFCDTDEIVQERAGLSIGEIFDKRGEAAFRALESAVVRECAAGEKSVIATGGGAVLDPTNVSALRSNGFVVHLTAEPHELWQRISKDPSTKHARPRLVKDAASGLEELKALMLARAAIYAEARHVEVDVEGRSPDETADAILLLMRARGLLK